MPDTTTVQGNGVDLVAAAQAKLHLNESRYPVDLARGSSRKHTEL